MCKSAKYINSNVANKAFNIQDIEIVPVRYQEYNSLALMSCGVVMLDEIGRVFLAHATKTPHWDIPKGHRNSNEMPRDASLRELKEETGITLEQERLIDLGCFTYRPDKDLYLFAVRITMNEIDITRCICTSLFFSDYAGTMIPEMDSFRWSKPDEVEDLVNSSLARLFRTQLSLANLHQWL